MNESSMSLTGKELSADEALYRVIGYILSVYLSLAVSMSGMATNLINIVIFWKLRLKDSMSVNVFALSLADFLTTFLQGVIGVCYLAEKLYPAGSIDALALGYFVFSWMLNAMYLSSCWITAVITIDRCCCVVLPFKVKQIFTRGRSFLIVFIIYSLLIGCHVPIYVLHRMEWVEVSRQSPTDSSLTEAPVRRLTILYMEDNIRTEKIFDILVSMALCDVPFVVVIVGTVWMIRSLRATSQIRHRGSLKSSGRQSHKSHLSNKERKLVKVALALATTLTLCSLPRVVVVGVQSSIPAGHIDIPPYLSLLWIVAYLCNSFGCSITVVVYLMLNNNFRAMFMKGLMHHKQMFRACTNQ